MALEKLQVKIGGMACSFCVETIKKGLGRTDGVAEVNVSLVHEEALIAYDPSRVTATTLTDTLRSLGYTVRTRTRSARSRRRRLSSSANVTV